jgi:hypothetical protein
MLLYAVGDLSRKRPDWVAWWADPELYERCLPPGRDGLARLAGSCSGSATRWYP